MNHHLMETHNQKYIEVKDVTEPLGTEQHALDLVSLSWEHGTPLFLIHGDALSEDFFQLRSGVAGQMLQKFTNYQLKVAALLREDQGQHVRFREMVLESNKGQRFRVFEHREDAEKWLLE